MAQRPPNRGEPRLTFVDVTNGRELVLATNPRRAPDHVNPELPPWVETNWVIGERLDEAEATITRFWVSDVQYWEYRCDRSNPDGSHELAHLYYGSLVARTYDLPAFHFGARRQRVRDVNIGTWEELQRRIHSTGHWRRRSDVGEETQSVAERINPDVHTGSDTFDGSPFDLEDLLQALPGTNGNDPASNGAGQEDVFSSDLQFRHHRRVNSDQTQDSTIWWPGWGPHCREHQRTHRRSASEPADIHSQT